MKKRMISMSIATMLMLGTVSFANEPLSLNVNDYKNYAYSVLEDKMGVTKSDLARDTEGLKKLDGYINNCLSMNVSMEEFKGMINSEIDVFKKSGENCEPLNESSKNKDNDNREYSYTEGYDMAKSIVINNYDVDREDLRNSKFEDYTEEIVDRYNASDKSKSFEEMFMDDLGKHFKKYKVLDDLEDILILAFAIVAFGVSFYIIYYQFIYKPKRGDEEWR